ncbi:hypothetical protein D3C81_1482420 [compost metagenome]
MHDTLGSAGLQRQLKKQNTLGAGHGERQQIITQGDNVDSDRYLCLGGAWFCRICREHPRRLLDCENSDDPRRDEQPAEHLEGDGETGLGDQKGAGGRRHDRGNGMHDAMSSHQLALLYRTLGQRGEHRQAGRRQKG